MSTASFTSTVISPTTTQVVERSAPISEILPLLSKIVSFSLGFVSATTRFLVSIISWVSYPIFLLLKAPIPLLLYVLSPFIAFGQIVLGLFFVVPYNAVVDVFLAVQPFYVFCGVACITGALVGIGGRYFAAAVSTVILGPEAIEGLKVDALDEKRKKRIAS